MRKAKRSTKGRYYNVVIERDANGFYVGSVPGLHGCHSQAKSLDELVQRIREAISLCVEVQKDIDPAGEFIGVQRISV